MAESRLPLCLALLLCVCISSATTVCVNVGQDSRCDLHADSIQEAVNEAAANDAVLVGAGSYSLMQGVSISAQPLSISSVFGSGRTFLSSLRGFPAFSNAAGSSLCNVTLAGFSITDSFSVNGRGAAIDIRRCQSVNVALSDLRIVNCTSDHELNQTACVRIDSPTGGGQVSLFRVNITQSRNAVGVSASVSAAASAPSRFEARDCSVTASWGANVATLQADPAAVTVAVAGFAVAGFDAVSLSDTCLTENLGMGLFANLSTVAVPTVVSLNRLLCAENTAATGACAFVVATTASISDSSLTGNLGTMRTVSKSLRPSTVYFEGVHFVMRRSVVESPQGVTSGIIGLYFCEANISGSLLLADSSLCLRDALVLWVRSSVQIDAQGSAIMSTRAAPTNVNTATSLTIVFRPVSASVVPSVSISNLLYASSGTLVITSSPNPRAWTAAFVNSSFTGNQAGNGLIGGSQKGAGVRVSFENCTFRSNRGQLFPFLGQLKQLDSWSAHLLVSRCVFIGNRPYSERNPPPSNRFVLAASTVSGSGFLLFNESLFVDNGQNQGQLLALRLPGRQNQSLAPPLAAFTRCSFPRGFTNLSIDGKASFASCSFGCQPAPAACPNYFVSSNGSDWAEGTALRPLKTIAEAIQRAMYLAGSTIYLGGQTWSGEGNWNLSVANELPSVIRIASWPAQPRAKIQLRSKANFVTVFPQGSLTISGVDFVGVSRVRGTYALIVQGQGSLFLFNCAFSEVIGSNGAAIALVGERFTSCTANITSCTFRNLKAVQGAALWASTAGPVFISRSTFSLNQAESAGGALYFINTTPVVISDSTFDRNLVTLTFSATATKFAGGAIAVVESVPGLQTRRCLFRGNRAANGGAISISTSQLSMTDDVLDGNQAVFGGGLFLVGLASLNNVTLSGNRADASSFTVPDPRMQASGGAIAAQDGGQLFLRRCLLVQNKATNGAGLFCTLGAQCSVLEGTVVLTNQATAAGGGCSVTGQGSLLLFRGATVTGNNALLVAGGVFVDAAFSAFNSTFSFNTAIQQNVGQGGALLFTEFALSPRFGIRNVSFVRNSAYAGGALYCPAGNSHRIYDTLRFEDCLFKRNVATLGGAVATESVPFIQIVRGSFLSNRASELGGAVYSGVQIVAAASNVLTRCTGSGNIASAGGAIYRSPFDTEQQWAQNHVLGTAKFYGNDTATQPVQWYAVPPAQQVRSHQQQQQQLQWQAVQRPIIARPGHPMNMSVVLLDAYRQLVTFTASAVGVPVVVDKSNSNCAVDPFPPNSEVFLQDGMLTFERLLVQPQIAPCTFRLLLNAATFQKLTGLVLEVTVEACHRGEGFVDGVGCLPCPQGQANIAAGKTPCAFCGNDTFGRMQFAPAGGTSCLPCPWNAQNGQRRNNESDCTCPDKTCAVRSAVRGGTPGQGSQRRIYSLCARCDAPLESKCTRSAWVDSQCPQTSWFAPAVNMDPSLPNSEQFGKVLLCPNGDACEGTTYSCSPGYTGVLCGHCSPGYGSLGDGVCASCPSTASRLAAFLGVVILLVAFCTYSAHKAFTAVAEQRTERSDLVPVLKLARDWAVTTLLFSQLSTRWSDEVRAMINAEVWLGTFTSAQAGGSSELASLRSLDCMLELIGTGSDPVMGRLVAALLFPLLAVLLQLLLVFCVRTVQQARNAQLQGRQINAERPPSLLMPGASAVDIAVLVAIVTFSAQQFAVSRVFLEAFSSTSANGESYLAQDTDVVSGSSRHHSLIAVAVLGLLLYAVGFSAALARALFTNRDRLDDPAVMRRFSYLYAGYRSHAFFFELVTSGRKLLLSALVSLIPFSGNQFFRLAALNIVYGAALALHIYVLPFRTTLLNRLEFASLALGFLTLALGLFFTDDSLPTAAGHGLTAVLLVLHVAFVLLLVAAAVRAAKCFDRCKTRPSFAESASLVSSASGSDSSSEPLLPLGASGDGQQAP